jgi:hypothetical protein
MLIEDICPFEHVSRVIVVVVPGALDVEGFGALFDVPGAEPGLCIGVDSFNGGFTVEPPPL